MRASERLDRYLQALRRRLRTHIYVRGAAAIAAGVLAFVGLIVWLLGQSGFAPASVIVGRVLIGAFVLSILVAFVWWPLHRLRRREGAEVFERKLPQQRGRIATYLDARRRPAHESTVLIELLAEDAARIASKTPVDALVPRRRIGFSAGVALLAIGALVWLLALAPGFWGFTSRHLLFAAELPREIVPVRKILVRPGDATVRRNSDLAIDASIEGFRPQHATVYVRFDDRQTWERAPMQPAAGEEGRFNFKLFALRSALKYYVAAEGTRSAEHTVTVADLPHIERVRLTYHYPEWTGLAPQIDEHSRDIRAVAGTNVTVEVFSDTPLEQPALIHDESLKVLEPREGANAGTLSIAQAGRYRITAQVAGERVALSDEYSIDIVPDEKPVVRIEKPGRDWRATNIEEVPVRVDAQDDFRLRSVELRYAVNGGEWQSISLARGVKESREQTVLELERIGAEQNANGGDTLLRPGDLVSYYAVAKDHKRSVETDLFIVQVQPFERKYIQQNAGGGGGMGDEQGAISERQREILLATWNLQRSDADNRRTRQQLEDNAAMLAEMQATLAQQARTLAARTRARAQVDADERIKHFVESLERAALAMEPAVLHLGAFELEQAVPVEQQALQQLLRAESAFRDVQVSMQNDTGGQGSQAARDFSEMFELEMDLEKSQYESESQFAEERTDKEMEEALRKLKELAARQEQLAQEANRDQALTPEQRWRQEQLRREAEDLRRQLAAMSQRQSGSQSQSQSQSQSGSQSESHSESQGQSASRGSAQGAEPRAENSQEDGNEALASVDRALEEMQAANTEQGGDPQDAANAAREAGKNLRQAAEQLDRPRQAGLDAALNELAERANRLADEQRSIESALYESLSDAERSSAPLRSRFGALDPERAQSLVEDKQKMAEALGDLQKDLRNSVHAHRDADETAKQRLAEIVNDVEASDLMYRVRRSAAEIYYGRARDAAAREGIITEALDILEKDLREAAVLAGREASQSPGEDAATERLLSEVADLRRRVNARQRAQATADGSSTQAVEQAPSQRALGEQRGQPSGDTSNEALSLWDPIVPDAGARNLEPGRDSFARQSAQIAERARRLGERADSRELSAAELASLRNMTRELRQLAGDPRTAESLAMKQAVEQLELTALAAITQRDRADAAQTAVPAGESPEYREAVAEYYRRLGGG